MRGTEIYIREVKNGRRVEAFAICTRAFEERRVGADSVGYQLIRFTELASEHETVRVGATDTVKSARTRAFSRMREIAAMLAANGMPVEIRD